ncbi:endolytic transglycosylase MltG [Glaciecola sp.]|uniref:endolytic transglycosylase MltG n=1 Tax=Glaciecola sp. MF2-115 TaxID=3384827 RepID=UPI003988D310
MFTLLLLTGVSAFLLYQHIDQFGNENSFTGIDSEVLVLQLKKGDSANSLLRKLEAKGVFSEALLAKLWIKLHPEYNVVKKGYYEFRTGTSLENIFSDISAGKVRQFSITLIEGLTLKQWLNALKDNRAIVYDISTTDALYEQIVNTPSDTNDGTNASFCNNQYRALEGCLLANTYFFDYETKASQIIQRAYNSMQKVISEAWQNRYLDTAYKTPYEMLIMASIIEKETAVESERGLISGVFDNRLKRNMRLQTDPTVIYGIGESFDGNLTRKHLREKTAYNTYVIKGLPITPIAMAGPASINAAAQPEMTEAVYFVARGDGTHQFSETLAEHNAAVRQFQLKKGK